MRKVQWIERNNLHCAVIVSQQGFVNLEATRHSYVVDFVSRHSDGDSAVYSSSAKNLKEAKRMSVAFGYSLIKNETAVPFERVEANHREKEIATYG